MSNTNQSKEEGSFSGGAPTWPKERDVGRREDMSHDGWLRVVLDGDGDVIVAVYDSEREAMGSVEFCTPFSGGGGSPRTREALIALMVAMEADNAESPRKNWLSSQSEAR